MIFTACQQQISGQITSRSSWLVDPSEAIPQYCQPCQLSPLFFSLCMGILESYSHESKIQLCLFSQIFFWPNQGKILLIHRELAQPHLTPLQWVHCITWYTTGQNCLVMSNFIAGYIAKLLRRLRNDWDLTSIVRIASL